MSSLAAMKAQIMETMYSRLSVLYFWLMRSWRKYLLKTIRALGCASCLLLIVLHLSGCYHWGSPGELPFATLYIAPVENDTYIPQAQSLVSSQLRKQFLREGRILLDNKDQADAILYTTLTTYTTSTAATQEKETGLPRSFSFGLTASISLYSVKEQKMLINQQSISSSVVTQIDGGAQLAEYQSIPTLAQELALKVKETVLNPW